MLTPGQTHYPSGGIIVTGAASGIGAAAARELASRGKDLALWDLSAARLEVVAGQCRALGVSVDVAVVDVGDLDVVRSATDRAGESLGGIGAVVASAGVALLDRAHAIDREIFRRMIRVNVEGVFNVVECAVPFLAQSGGGSSVAVVSSMEGLNAHPYVASYTMAKHAVNGFVRSAALSLGPQGVRVNAVCPGPVDTPMFASGENNSEEEVAKHRALIASLPLGYVCSPEEIATILRFLVSSDASYLNGTTIVADGGRDLH